MTGTFRALHRPGDPLLLPNAWDHASAVALQRAGFAAIGTTSLGLAAAEGLPDATADLRDRTVALARMLGRLPVPVTIDAASGFGTDPGVVAALAVELADAGAAGLNLEDAMAPASASLNLEDAMAPAEHHAGVIRAVKAAVPDLFLNARTDTYWLGPPDLDETLRRVRAYAEAGADGVFVPGIAADAEVAAVVAAAGVPVNVLALPGRTTVRGLAALGVARISTGSLLYRAALAGAVAAARAVAADEPAGDVPSYAEVDGWAGPG